MTDNTELRDINAGNVNFGEQIFNGNVYIINGTVTQDKPTEQTRVFLSYARADNHSNYDDPAKSLLRRLTENLTNAAFAVWWDRKSLPSRSVPFSKEIETAIRDSDRFVLVVGPNASTSEWVRAELRYALELCKPITAILRAGDYDLMPVEIERINAIDFRAPRKYEDALKDLITRLGQPAPLGNMLNVKPLPTAHVRRAKAFDDAHAAICADAIAPTVISAPPRATAVFGYGGVGKSTLATALAHDCDVRRTFPDGVIWLEVGQTPNLSALQASIGATVFGDNRENYQDAHTGQLALSQILHGKTALIVLDDVWDHRIVAHFPIADTACRLLITTRSGALAKQIEGADIRLNLLSPEEGAALIAKRVGGAADDTVYKAISTALGGHTLAIALAAAQLANGYADNASDLLRLLTKRENPFAHLKLSDDDDEKTGDKNENLELSLSLSYKVLKPDLQRRFRLLGIFALESSFTRATLAAIWGDEDEDDSRAPLKTLLDSGLLEDSGNARYGQHRLLRIYARALLDEANELDDAAKRHFEHYSGLHGSEQDHTDTDYLQSITIDFENLYIAIEWGLKHATETGLDFIATLSNYLGVYQATAVYQPMLIDALTAAERVGYVEGQANTLRALGDLSVRQSELEAARAYYDRALPIYDQIGTRLGQANTLRALGDLSVRQSELEAARAYYDRALPIYDQIGTRLGQANTLRALGDLSVRQEELEAARAYYDRALPIYDQIGTRLGQANTLQALGDLSVRQEELEAARAYYDRALPIYDQIGTRLGQANTLQALGDLSVRQSELEAARAYYDRALPIYDQIGARVGQANTLRALGNLSVRQDELEAARAYYDRALPIYDQIGDRVGQANTLQALGDLSVRQSELEAARAYYDRALPIYDQIGDRVGQANTLQALGDLSVRQSELEAARAYYDRALPIYDQIDARVGQANTLKALGDLSVRQDELEAARAYYDRALPIYDQIGDRVGQANTLRALGDLSVRQDELEAARAYYDRALPIYDQIDARLGQANTLRALGDLSVRQSELEAARAYYDRALPIYDQIDARLGQANTLMSLGDMLVKQLLWTDAIDYYEQALPIVRAIHDRLGTANILYDYGLALYEVGQTEAGIEALAECAALFEAIHFERWVVHAKRRLADLLRRSGRDEEANSITTPSDENAQRQQAIQALRQIYDHGGEAAVRQALQGQVEDVVIDQLIAQFENSPSTESEGNPDLLPKQTIEMLAGNSIAVKTGVAEKFAEWRAQVDELKTEWGEQGDDYIAETAFADALLAILDDQPTALAQDNPYFAVVQQVIETIQAYQKGN